MNGKIILGVGLPAYGAKVAMWQVDMWMQLGFALATSETRFELRATPKLDVCGVDVARNRLVEEAIVTGCDWLLLVDADTWHDEPGCGYDLLQMVSDADRAGDVGIVAAPVPRRDPNNTDYMIYDNFPHHMDQKLFDGKLVECETVATALCALNINFIKKRLTPPWFTFEWTGGTTRFTSEDVLFCRKVLVADGKVMVDGRFRAKHLQRPEILKGPPLVFGT
jgi:hypothetical protein